MKYFINLLVLAMIASMLELSVNGLTKDYPGVKALDNINFSVRPGSIHGFLGPNGAGKTTAMKIIAGLLKASGGEISFNQKNWTKDEKELKRLVGLMPDRPPLYNFMSVKEFLNFVADLYQVPQKTKRINEIVELLGIGDEFKKVIGHLSKGFRQRVNLAQAIIAKPAFLILDEPASGLDPKATRAMRNLLLELKKEHTILLSSHLLHEVSLSCDDITIINKGKILLSGPLPEVIGKYQTRQIVNIEALNWSSCYSAQLSKLTYVERLEEGGSKVRVFIKGAEDQRAELCSDLVNMGVRLVGVGSEKASLEDIFVELVQ